MFKYIFIALIISFATIQHTAAQNSVSKYVPNAQLVGKGRLSVFIWDIFDASLHAPNGKWHKNQPYAFTLSYLRNFKGTKIAERSIEEIRKQGINNELLLADWYIQMANIFPNVSKGEAITAIHNPNRETIFLKDAKEIGRIKDKDFGVYFFNIWLGQQTENPKLRLKLLGLS